MSSAVKLHFSHFVMKNKIAEVTITNVKYERTSHLHLAFHVYSITSLLKMFEIIMKIQYLLLYNLKRHRVHLLKISARAFYNIIFAVWTWIL